MESRSNEIWGLTHESSSRTEKQENEGFHMEMKMVVMSQESRLGNGVCEKRRWLRNREGVVGLE